MSKSRRNTLRIRFNEFLEKGRGVSAIAHLWMYDAAYLTGNGESV